MALPVMLCRLQVDDDQFAAIALGQQRDVAAGHNLQGGAQTHTQVSLSGTQMEQMENVLPIGMICRVVSRHTLRSACLEYKWNKWKMCCQ